MSDIDRAVRASRRFETWLEKYFDARGRGLHEKISSVAGRLPKPLVRQLRFIATVRNKVVHESGGRIDDRAGFVRACRQAERQLKRLGRGRGRSRRRRWAMALIVTAVVVVAAVVALAKRMGWLTL